jgi:catechol 2,3-dioxygenase-like lactoylglutathione lyase family enzyme
MMRVKALGHAVLKVRSLERSAAFYRDLLGMREVARYRGKMAFFSLGVNHHDLALMEVGTHAADADLGAAGLYHLAFKVGDTPQMGLMLFTQGGQLNPDGGDPFADGGQRLPAGIKFCLEAGDVPFQLL